LGPESSDRYQKELTATGGALVSMEKTSGSAGQWLTIPGTPHRDSFSQRIKTAWIHSLFCIQLNPHS